MMLPQTATKPPHPIGQSGVDIESRQGIALFDAIGELLVVEKRHGVEAQGDIGRVGRLLCESCKRAQR